jgi:hypothetical protein
VAIALLAAVAALHVVTHGPRGAAGAPLGLPSLASTFRSPVAAVGEAVRAYPSIFRTARDKLMLGEPGSAGDLTKTNGLFSVDVHDICPMLTCVRMGGVGLRWCGCGCSSLCSSGRRRC